MENAHILPMAERSFDPVYHGTSQENWESIRQQGRFVVAKARMGKSPGYLGDGVYFYESSHEDAWIWAKDEKRFPLPVVVKACIQALRCIDCCDWSVVKALDRAYVKFEKRMRNEGREPKEPYFFHWLGRHVLKEIDCIRACQRRPSARRELLWSRFESNRLVICVKKPEVIAKFEIFEENQKDL